MRPPPAGAVEVRGLSKSYGRRAVLHSVDLRVPAGGVLALLGPNGAGKTTTVRVLATLTGPDAGSVRVAGYDVVTERRRVQRAISLTGQFAAVDETQTGAENLWTTARLAGLTRAAARARAAGLLERFGLRPEESLFIDDAQANVEGARAVGMAALRFDGDVGRIRAEMKKLGLFSGTGLA